MFDYIWQWNCGACVWTYQWSLNASGKECIQNMYYLLLLFGKNDVQIDVARTYLCFVCFPLRIHGFWSMVVKYTLQPCRKTHQYMVKIHTCYFNGSHENSKMIMILQKIQYWNAICPDVIVIQCNLIHVRFGLENNSKICSNLFLPVHYDISSTFW